MLMVKYRVKETGQVLDEAPVLTLSLAKQVAVVMEWEILSVTRPAENGWPAMTFTTFQ